MPNLVNSSVFSDLGVGTSLTKTLGFTPADGSSVALLILVGDPARSVSAVTGYTVAGTVANVNSLKYEVWIRNGVTGSPTTAAITLDGSTYAFCAALNFDDDVTFVQLTAKFLGNNTTPGINGGADDDITVAANSFVGLLVVSNFSRTWSAALPSGFAFLNGSATDLQLVYDADIGAGGTIQPSATIDTANYWEAATLELSGSAPSGTTPIRRDRRMGGGFGPTFDGGMSG